jgi:hypothetical protein
MQRNWPADKVGRRLVENLVPYLNVSVQTPRARAEIRPAMRHDRRRIFPMDSPQSRVAARYQTVTETQSPAAAENKISQSRQK